MNHYDAIVIGGGFFGSRLALHLKSFLGDVLLLEDGEALLRRASYNNQARIHQGYHYPHSLLTALRSRVNFARFTAEYAECVVNSFEKYYAISSAFSSVTALQFRTFCERIGAPIEPCPSEVRRLFTLSMVEDVFLVQEWAFDATKLRSRMQGDLKAVGVDVRMRTRASRLVARAPGIVTVEAISPEGESVFEAKAVFNCTYSALNRVLAASGLPLIPLKHEGTEIALVDPPAALRDKGVTVMCGPFFSVMPFPPRQLHSFSHVRYTPHVSWPDDAATCVNPPWDPHQPGNASALDRMIRDARRYMPCLAECRARESLWEIKTVLPASELDDSRPILFRRHQELGSVFSVLGGKIDNIYDVLRELDVLRGTGELG